MWYFVYNRVCSVCVKQSMCNETVIIYLVNVELLVVYLFDVAYAFVVDW